MKFVLNKNSKNEESIFTKNGVNFQFINKKSKYIGTSIMFNNGKNAESYFDENGNFVENSHGMAHFLEHLLFSSASENINYLQKLISEKWNMNGATGNGIVYYYIVEEQNTFIENYLDHLMKIAFTLDINEEIFENEKGIVATEASMSLDETYIKHLDKLKKYFSNSHQAHHVPGTPETVNGITMEEVVNYYKDVYSLDNCTVVVVGDFKDNEELVQRYLNKFFDNLENIRNNFEIHVQDKGVKRNVASLKHINFDQGHYDVRSPKVSMESTGQIIAVNSDSDEPFGLELLAFTSFIAALTPNQNMKVRDLFIENGFNPQFSTFGVSNLFDCLYAFDISWETNDFARKEEFGKLVLDIFNNYEKYVDYEDVIKFLNTSKYSDIKKFDMSLEETLSSISGSKFGFGGMLKIFELEDELVVSDYINEKNVKRWMNSIDWNNYVSFSELKSEND